MRLSVNYPIPRCLMVNLEPTTGANDPRYLKAVAHGGKAEAGVYASVAALGRLRVGDEVWLLD